MTRGRHCGSGFRRSHIWHNSVNRWCWDWLFGRRLLGGAAKQGIPPLRHHSHRNRGGGENGQQSQYDTPHLDHSTVQTLIHCVAAYSQQVGNLVGTVSIKAQTHHTALVGAEGGKRIVDGLVGGTAVAGRKCVGQRIVDRHRMKCFMAPLAVEHRASLPTHPGTLLVLCRARTQLATILPQGDGHLLHKVATTVPLPVGAQPTHAPKHRTVAQQQTVVFAIGVHL